MRLADSGEIVRAAIAALKDTPSPRPQGHTGLTKLYQTLRSTVVTVYRQRLIADLLKCYYDQILDIHFFTFSYTIGVIITINAENGTNL